MWIGRRFLLALSLVILFVSLLVEPTVGRAQPPPTKQLFCLQDLPRAVLLGPIPVGCESIDCCPGCPARAAIDWRIRLAADAVEAMVLEFEGLPADARGRLTIEGEGRWLDERRLEILPGMTLVRGFPRALGGRSPVAVARVSRMRSGLDVVRDADRPLEFSVEQFVGRVRVNESRSRYWLVNCVRPPVGPASQDVVRLDNNTSGDNGIVLLDARRSAGCVNDEVLRGSGNVSIGNALSNGVCRSEVVVFSNHHAVQVLPNVTTWTDAAGDLLPVPLVAPWSTPVVIRVLVSPFTTSGGTGKGDIAQDDVDRANDLYGTMNCGLALQPTIIDATGNPNAPGLLTRMCSQAASLRTQIGFDPGKINVYYIADVKRDDAPDQSVRGATCGMVLSSTDPNEWNTILVSTLYEDPETLAHELGHAFTLAHTNANPDFTSKNIMWGSGANRTYFTEGQCFRVNVNSESALNKNGVRTGPTRSCPDGTTSDECPALSLDVTPNN